MRTNRVSGGALPELMLVLRCKISILPQNQIELTPKRRSFKKRVLANQPLSAQKLAS
jgi:hypothetical protein